MDPNLTQIVLAFVTGLTTGGLSCLAVQGGLLASSIAHEVEQTVRETPSKTARQAARSSGQATRTMTPQTRAARPIILFLGAKLIAYTLLGFLLGLVGSMIQMTTTARAVLQLAIGIFMVGNALRMLNVHPIFRYFALEPPSAVTRYIRRKSKAQVDTITPVFLGTLTVLIPCGVTQAIMAIAIGTGSPVMGATLMFAFILGTSPVFFAIAYLATRLGSRLEASFMRIVAIVVLVLGLISVEAGLTLLGSPYSFNNLRLAANTALAGRGTPDAESSAAAAQIVAPPTEQRAVVAVGTPRSAAAPLLNMVGAPLSNSGVVTITVQNNGYVPALTRARANQPLKLSLVTNKTYSCARSFVIPSLRIEKQLSATGVAVIDIPAQSAGHQLFYSCSMGMYSGVINFDG